MSKKQNTDKNKTSETLRAIAHFSHIGVTMAASVLVGVLIGKYLDGLLGTTPWLLLVFSLLGAGAAIKVLFNISKK
ncbi:MAG: AtpZ/AtpI family protein [Oscillospiraceae bacterium]|nr:AtpZ/AtpI family protein [Oscillospiraceae bacterium]